MSGCAGRAVMTRPTCSLLARPLLPRIVRLAGPYTLSVSLAQGQVCQYELVTKNGVAGNFYTPLNRSTLTRYILFNTRHW